MTKEEFAKLLARLKQKKISNAKFADWVGYSKQSICKFASGKMELPLSIIRACEFLRYLELVGVDISEKIKSEV